MATREVLKYFAKQDGVRWSFEYKARGNKKIDRTEILNVSPSAQLAANLYFNNFVVKFLKGFICSCYFAEMYRWSTTLLIRQGLATAST